MKRAIAALTLTVPTLLGLVAPAARAATSSAPALAPSATVWFGEFTISNEASHRCLDADTTMGGVNGNKVQIWDCNLMIQQDWNFWETSSGSNVYYIVSQKYGKCLDQDLNTLPRNGTKVQLWDCNYQKQQLWYLPWMASGNRTSSWYQFFASSAHGSVLDADNSHGNANGSQVQLWQNLNGSNQYWHIGTVG